MYSSVFCDKFVIYQTRYENIMLYLHFKSLQLLILTH